jgi:hypothetical protein
VGTFTGSRVDTDNQSEVINLNQIFGTGAADDPLDIREVLPEFNAHNEPVIGTFPPTDDSSDILNGILPSSPKIVTNEDATREFELMPNGQFSIPTVANGSMTIDGSFSDWTQGKVFDDISNDDPEITYNGSKDLKSFWMVQDDDYYYMRAVFHDGAYTSGDYPSIRFYAKVDPTSGYEYWAPTIGVYPYIDSGHGIGQIDAGKGGNNPIANYYGPTNVNVGLDGSEACVEWRIFKTDIGDLSGRFIELNTGKTQYDWEDYNPTFMQFPGYTVSGTVAVDGCTSGDILLYLYDGEDPDNSELLASTMIDYLFS